MCAFELEFEFEFEFEFDLERPAAPTTPLQTISLSESESGEPIFKYSIFKFKPTAEILRISSIFWKIKQTKNKLSHGNQVLEKKGKKK